MKKRICYCPKCSHDNLDYLKDNLNTDSEINSDGTEIILHYYVECSNCGLEYQHDEIFKLEKVKSICAKRDYLSIII